MLELISSLTLSYTPAPLKWEGAEGLNDVGKTWRPGTRRSYPKPAAWHQLSLCRVRLIPAAKKIKRHQQGKNFDHWHERDIT